MSRSYLLVHPTSYRNIAGVVDYIYQQLKKYSSSEVELSLCSEIDAVAVESGSVIFIIGDPFGNFTPRPNCRYIFLNFSLLYPLGEERAYSQAGLRWVDRKHRKFAVKVRQYDYILDCYPHQAGRISNEFGIPTRHFAIGLGDDAYSVSFEREYDVCVVGARTPRRLVLANRLTRMGLRLSPFAGVSLDSIAARSKVVLNLHAYRTANAEFPRIVSALLSGAVLLTEPSAAIADRFPANLYVSARYGDVAQAIQALLDDPRRREKLSSEANTWMRMQYLPDCEQDWKSLVRHLDAAFSTA